MQVNEISTLTVTLTQESCSQGVSCFLSRNKLKERLGVPSRVTIGYEVHDDTITRKGSVARSKYTL